MVIKPYVLHWTKVGEQSYRCKLCGKVEGINKLDLHLKGHYQIRKLPKHLIDNYDDPLVLYFVSDNEVKCPICSLRVNPMELALHVQMKHPHETILLSLLDYNVYVNWEVGITCSECNTEISFIQLSKHYAKAHNINLNVDASTDSKHLTCGKMYADRRTDQKCNIRSSRPQGTCDTCGKWKPFYWTRDNSKICIDCHKEKKDPTFRKYDAWGRTTTNHFGQGKRRR